MAGDKGDVAEKIELLRQAQRVNEHLGDREGARFTQAKIAAEMFERGNWDGALEVVDDFIADCEAGRGHIQEAGVRCMRAWISLGRGEVEDALVDSERAVALARDLGAYDPAGALAWVANIYTHLGDIAEAQALADELISQGPETVADLGFDLAWIADRIGRSAAFLRVTDTASYEETAGTWFRPIPELILAGDAAKAADRLGEMGRWATEADTRLLAARQLIQSDEYEEANEQLEKALAFYNSVGATRFIREAESLVSITG